MLELCLFKEISKRVFILEVLNVPVKNSKII